jgi:Phage tail assembly chaperone proteins, E, or 41 or 14
MRRVKLIKPTQLNGKEYEELNLDGLDLLRGKDLRECKDAFAQLYRGEIIPILNIDDRYLMLVTSAVVKINPKDLENLWAPDYEEVCTTVRNFLMKSDSDSRTIQSEPSLN